MDARNIVIDYLKRNGFDGLCREDCGCGLDDFAPCGDDISECFPAKAVQCDGSCNDCSEEQYDPTDICYRKAKISEPEETHL